MLKEKILDYLYEINARCDYKLEEVAEDIISIVEENCTEKQGESAQRWHDIIGF